jgi:hypothetical protein
MPAATPTSRAIHDRNQRDVAPGSPSGNADARRAQRARATVMGRGAGCVLPGSTVRAPPHDPGVGQVRRSRRNRLALDGGRHGGAVAADLAAADARTQAVVSAGVTVNPWRGGSAAAACATSDPAR